MPEGATETLPLITSAPTAQQNDDEQGNAGISDDEAYAKLKAKRAERRRKKLVRRGIAAGIVGGIVLIAIIVSVVLNSQPQSAGEPVTDMVMEGTFTTTVEAKGQLKPISASVVAAFSWDRQKRACAGPLSGSVNSTGPNTSPDTTILLTVSKPRLLPSQAIRLGG